MRSTIYCTPDQNIIQVIKSRRVSWAGHGMYRGEERCIHSIDVEIFWKTWA